VERDVVPIESLYQDGDSSPLTPPPGQPHFEAPAALGPLELVSHGEHLCQIADLIARSRSAVERDLRLYHLIGALRAAGSPGPDPVAGALSVFARSTREALAAGLAGQSTDALVSHLKAAGELLRSVADAEDRMQVSRRMLDVAHKLDQLRTGATEPAATPAADDDSDVVPIASLAYDEPQADGADSLEASFRTLERLQRERSPGAAGAEPAGEAVAIEALCYRGRSALERAAVVRQTLTAELAGVPDLAAIRPLLQELLDLVPLALDES
jgi:hypothetical protein